MTPRKHWIIATALLIVTAVPAVFALSWDELYAERLQEDLAYRQAALGLRQAELRVAQYDEFYVPYLSIGTPGQTAIRYVGGEDGGLQPFTLQPSLSFTNVFGASVALGLPVTVVPSPAEGQDSVSIGDPGLTVSRRIFEETTPNVLGARAALVRAQDAERGAREDLRIGLVNEVFEARAAAQTLSSTQQQLENARRIRDASRDETAERDLERSILQAERAVIQAERALRNIDERIIGQADALYADILDRFDEWITDLPEPDTIPPTTADIEAQRLAVAAADARRAFAFLPYIPNPSLSATVSWDRDESELNWSIGLQFSVTLVDRGERAVAALERREGAEIERLRLDAAVEAFDRNVRTAWEELTLLELDSRIRALDLEDQIEATERTRDLFAAGFATEESLVSAELALSSAELTAERAEHSYRVQQLRVRRLFE